MTSTLHICSSQCLKTIILAINSFGSLFDMILKDNSYKFGIDIDFKTVFAKLSFGLPAL